MTSKTLALSKAQIKRRSDLIWKIVDGQIVILDIEKSILYELNEMGSLIWKMCRNYMSYNDLIDKITDIYDVTSDDLRSDLTAFFDKNSFLFKFR